MGNWNTGGGGGRGGSGVEVDRNMGIDRDDEGGNESRPSYDFDLNRSIREFRTGMPTLTRGEALRLGNISPYNPSAVSLPQMTDGFVDRPARNFNLELEFNAPTRFSGIQRPPTMSERIGTYIDTALGGRPALEKRVVGLDKEGKARTPTYQITSENQAMDFIGSRMNAFPFISFDTRTGIPLTSAEEYQVSRVDSPFGTSENIVSYADLQNQFTPPDDSYVIPPTMVAQRTAPRSLVPMGRAGVGRALDPSTAYNPFGLLG